MKKILRKSIFEKTINAFGSGEMCLEIVFEDGEVLQIMENAVRLYNSKDKLDKYLKMAHKRVAKSNRMMKK